MNRLFLIAVSAVATMTSANAAVPFMKPSFPSQAQEPKAKEWSEAELKAAEHTMAGNDLLAEGRPAEALDRYQKALAVLPKAEDAERGVARSYFALGKTREALKAYRALVYWDETLQELAVKGGPIQPTLLEYAILLARTGDAPGAKAAYYAGLRVINPKHLISVEPIPFLIVFDPEPKGEVWSYTPERLEAAASAAIVVSCMVSQKESFAFLDRAAALVPDWSFPSFQKGVMLREAPGAEACLKCAESLEQDSRKRQIMAAYRVSHTGDPASRPRWEWDPSAGGSGRLQMKLLEEAKARLWARYHK